MAMPSNPISLLDCTLRDGGYYNHWDFPESLIADYLAAMAAISVDFVEIGLRSLDRRGFRGAAAYSSDDWIRSLPVPAGLRIGVMVNAAELIAHAGGVTKALQQLFVPAAESPVSLVRLACHVHEYEQALPACAWLQSRGYLVGLNLMQVSGLDQASLEDIGQRCAAQPPDVLYFADSLGSLGPQQVAVIVNALRRHWRGALGIHTHDNMTQALANCLRALDEGANWLDCTVTGMGRGPGNVKTEYLVLALRDRRKAVCNITPLLAAIARHFAPMQAMHGWGANPYYFLAGQYGIHPTYIQEMLNDSRYNEADILAVIEHFRQAGAKTFSADSLESARHFYRGAPRGSWSPSAVMEGREVLVLGPGPSLAAHRSAIEQYIRRCHPYVIALNTQAGVAPELIDARAACHPIRLLADCEQHLRLPQPLITPRSMLPQDVVDALGGKTLLDYGIAIEPRLFGFHAEYAVLPTSLVVAYVLAIATSGKATRILLAGFDGYGADDPRTEEMDNLLHDYRSAEGALPVLGITPSRYKVDLSSVYALLSMAQ